jgi:hypothetical protein
MRFVDWRHFDQRVADVTIEIEQFAQKRTASARALWPFPAAKLGSGGESSQQEK